MITTKPTLGEFRKFKEKVDGFYSKTFAGWDVRLLFEAAEDRDFMNFVSTSIDKAMQANLSYEKLDALLILMRNKADELLQETRQVSISDIDKKFDFVNRTMAIMGFVECMNEDSALSEKILSNIQKKFGDGYLDVLQELDKKYLSVDGKKLYGIKDEQENWPEDDDIRKYLILKRWQDKQHIAFANEFENDAWSYEDNYIDSKDQNSGYSFFPEWIPYTYGNRAVKIRALLKMSNQGLTSIDEATIYYLCGLDKELVKLFGGKAYGLIRLNASGAKIPETFFSSITCENLSEKDLEKLPSNTNFAIRSSADIEDGDKHSFAGMFDSVLNVSREDIFKSFDSVKKSIYSNRVKAYIEHNNLPNPKMAVVIQAFKEPEYAGVWMGTGDGKGILEWVKGNGEKLVSGKTSPTTERWDTDDVSHPLTISNKAIAIDLMNLQSLISSTGMADFEWCILDGKLLMLQYRPVTTKILPSQENTNSLGEKIIKGLPASKGVVEGPAKLIYTVDEKTQWNEGDILISRYTSPEWMNVLTKVGGVVTAFGGLLSHSAIVSRELGVPCVVGIGYEGLNEIKEKKYLKVDGNQGIVIIKNNENLNEGK